MADIIDVKKLVADIKTTVSGIIDKDFPALTDFQERQLTGMAERAATIAAQSLAGRITEEQRKFFLDDLAKDAKTFAAVVAGLVAITIEKAWNAIVGVIWGAINAAVKSAVGAAIPLPKFPG